MTDAMTDYLKAERTLRHIIELSQDDQVSADRRLNMIRVAIEKYNSHPNE